MPDTRSISASCSDEAAMKDPKERKMRKILLTTAATVAIASAAGLFAGRADALPLPAQSGVREAIDSTNLTENVRWVCRYNWRGFRRCWWEPGYPRRYWRYRYY